MIRHDPEKAWRFLWRGKRARLSLAGVLMVAAGLLVGGPAMAGDELTKLRFTLDWIQGSAHGPFFIALYKGYYKEEGLDVTIVPGKGSAEVSDSSLPALMTWATSISTC